MSLIRGVWVPLLAALLPALAPASASAADAASPLEIRFAALRNDPPSLYAFLLRMPKGGDLHNHITGAVYAESYLRAAEADGLCVNPRTESIVASEAGGACGDNLPVKRVNADNTLRNALIDSLSMRDFIPGRESGHDHFFAAFGKFGPIKPEHRGEFLAEVTQRASDQNESYLELMAINASAANQVGDSAGFDGNFDAARERLEAGGLEKVVDAMRQRIDSLEKSRRSNLGCDANPLPAPCRVVVRYMIEVLRESTPQRVFAQILAGMRLAMVEPMVVGINFVQPEDGVVSMRDYSAQMRMVAFARKLYPKVHVSLHAGELALGLVPPDALRFHVKEAVDVAGADRIGHGVDVLYETDSAALLQRMRQRHVLVEINLSSNDQILGVRGSDHPFNAYRRAGVPLALSTDDEGVARSHLTAEFQRAVLTYKLSYADVKELARNSLRYSFLDDSAKAPLQQDLESRFRVFESSVR
jgi:adenosine deaminase